jgi:protein subunit release factor B
MIALRTKPKEAESRIHQQDMALSKEAEKQTTEMDQEEKEEIEEEWGVQIEKEQEQPDHEWREQMGKYLLLDFPRHFQDLTLGSNGSNSSEQPQA